MRVQTSVALFTRTNNSGKLLFSFVLCICFFSHSVFAVVTTPSIPSEQLVKLKNAQQNIVSKEYTQAIDLVNSVLDEYPMLASAQIIRAQALAQMGNLDEAIKSYQSLLKSEVKPALHRPEIYNNLATLYAKQGKLELARQTLEDGIATNEQYKTLYENLSAIYVEMARGAYSKALQLGVQAKTVQLKTLQPTTMQLASIEPPQRIVKVKQAAVDNNINEKQNTTDVALLNKIEKVASVKMEQTKKPEVVVEPAAAKKTIIKTPKIKTGFAKKQVPEINKDEVITALHGWAAAWSAQAVDLYLSFYGEDFKPVKLSKKVWAVQRRIRLSKPRWVNVRLNDFNVKVESNHKDKAIVQVVQDYRADNYQDKTKKQFVMKRTIDGWRILSEKSLAVIR